MSEATRLQLIEELCDKAASKISISDIGFVTEAGYGDSRLLESGIYFHELSKDEVIAAALGLTKILSPVANFTFVNQDQMYLWAWCAQIFTDSNTVLRKDIKPEVLSFMRLATHTALTCFDSLSFSSAGIKIGVHSRAVLSKTHISLLFLTLPLLEALLRFCCRGYVNSDGVVKATFPRGKKGESYKEGSICSNLGHLISLYRAEFSDTVDKQCAIKIFNLLESTQPNADFAKWLFKLRNSALHGEEIRSHSAALVLNICFSLCLGEINDNQYGNERDWVYKGVLWNSRLYERPDWSIYPPES